MIDINSAREKNTKRFVDLLIQREAYIDKRILLTHISEDNFGFISKEEIDPKKKIILIPNKLLIPKKNIKSFLINDKTISYDEELINSYFSLLPKYEFFKKNNFLFLNDTDIKKCLNFFKSESPIKKSIETLFKTFNELESDIDKYVHLLYRTRSFNVKNQSYLAPLLDFTNFNFNTRGYFVENNSVFFNSEKKLKKNDEIFQSYNLNVDPIKFYLNYSFYPENYSNLTFYENQIILNVSKDVASKIDTKYWNVKHDQTISNKNPVSFYNCEVPLIISLMFDSLFKNENLKFKAISNFIMLVKNQFNYNEVKLFLENKSGNKILIDFAKSINLYISNLDKILDNLQK
tara:strand:- start:171 stop:1211 length:1041 start_codon:yes stop_codon:yes gene_type:complete